MPTRGSRDTAKTLKRRNVLAELLAGLATEFINLPPEQVDAGINQALRAIGEYGGVDRASLLELDPDAPLITTVYEWARPNVASFPERMEGVPLQAYAWAAPQLLAGNVVAVPDVTKLPPEAAGERAEAEAQGTTAFAMVPVRSEGRVIAALGCDQTGGPHGWSEAEIGFLKVCAEMFANTIMRRRSEQERAQLTAQLKRRADMQHLLLRLSTRFIDVPIDRLDESIDLALERLGEFSGADRAYVFTYDLDARTMSNSHEWTAGGISAEAHRVQGLPLDAVPYFTPIMEAGNPFAVADVTQLPDAAAAERAEFETQSIRSLLCVPLRRQRRSIGFLGLDAVRRPRRWTEDEIALLQLSAEVIANAMSRRDAGRDRARLERQVRQAQKLESLGVLAGGIAHDFNNLLTTMLGNASLALEDLEAGGPVHHAVRQVHRAAERARDLTAQMLAYAGRGQVEITAVNLSQLVEEMAGLLRVGIGKKTALDLALARDLPPVAADATQLRQVVMNLLTNAAEALGDQAGMITVQTRTTAIPEAAQLEWLPDDPRPGDYVELRVTDSGTGMDDATRARIFDPFYTTKFEGRGLGLAAALGIVGTHGGALHVESAPGGGTEFRVLWPCSDAPEPAATAPAPASSPTGGHAAHGTTLLLVDDEAGVRTVGRQALERAGYTVLTAADGRRAIELYRMHANDIALVVLDLAMPEMDGVETFGELRRIRKDAAVLLSSGYTEMEAMQRFQDAGLRGFLQKPYTAGGLREAVERAVAAG
jgi:signal transduction histidine kinase